MWASDPPPTSLRHVRIQKNPFHAFSDFESGLFSARKTRRLLSLLGAGSVGDSDARLSSVARAWRECVCVWVCP